VEGHDRIILRQYHNLDAHLQHCSSTVRAGTMRHSNTSPLAISPALPTTLMLERRLSTRHGRGVKDDVLNEVPPLHHHHTTTAMAHNLRELVMTYLFMFSARQYQSSYHDEKELRDRRFGRMRRARSAVTFVLGEVWWPWSFEHAAVEESACASYSQLSWAGLGWWQRWQY